MNYKLLLLATIALLTAVSCCEAALKTHRSSTEAILDIFDTLKNKPRAAYFVPPEDWLIADPSQLPKTVRLMAVGKGHKEYPPSINLASEPYSGTIKDYLKVIKEINAAEGREWKTIGQLETEAGTANLSQVDDLTEWGRLRMMHVVLLRDHTIYVMTAAALRDEFALFRPQFLKAMRSLTVNADALHMVEDASRQALLKQQCDELIASWQLFVNDARNRPAGEGSVLNHFQALFSDECFQSEVWIPFWREIGENYGDMSPRWREGLLGELHEQLVNTLSKAEEPLTSPIPVQELVQEVSHEIASTDEVGDGTGMVVCGSCSSQSLRAARSAGL